MNKRLTKQFTKNIRLDAPLGLLGVPPDAPVKIYVPAGGAVVIITDRPVIRRHKDLPQ